MSIDPVSLAITVALTAGNMALTATQKIEGPRQDTRFTSGDYGAPVNRVYGMRRISPPIVFGEPLKEVKQRRKTKGGKYNDYTYYGTWAVLLACHQIDAVRRVWFDTHLVLDFSGAGPVTPFDFGADGSLSAASAAIATGNGKSSPYFAIYLGTEDQEPDPRILATTEARNGEGTCPAYRGRALLVLKDVPLGKLGNRIPQTSAEIVSHASAGYPYKVLPDAYDTLSIAFAADYSLLYLSNSVIDVAATAKILSASFPPDTTIYDVGADGLLWGIAPIAGEAWIVSVTADGSAFADQAGGPLKWPDGTTNTTGEDLFVFNYSDRTVIGVAPFIGRPNLLYYDTANVSTVISLYTLDISGAQWAPMFWCQDADGDIWAGGTIQGPTGPTSTFYLYSPTNGRSLTVAMPTTLTAGGERVIPFRHYADSTHDQFVIQWAGQLVFASRSDGSVLGTSTLTDSAYTAFKECPPRASSFYILDSFSSVVEISAADGSLVRALNLNDWHAGASCTSGVYDPINHAWIGLQGGDATLYYLDRVSSDGIPLAVIITDICRLSGLSDDQFDTSLLTDIVPGYSCSQGSGKDWLEPLLSLYDIDARPHGFQLQFLPRGGASGASLSYDGFALVEGGDGPLYSFPRSGGTDVPITVKMQFADIAADQQPAPATSGPLSALDGKREISLDMSTLALGKDAARQLTGRYHRRQLMDRVPYTLSLPASQIGLEPGDVHPLALRAVTQTARLTSMVVGADRQIHCEWRRDDASIHALDGGAGADFAGRDPSVVVVPLLSKGFVLDVPLLTDAHNSANPLLYIGAAPYAAGTWPGATIYEQTTGGEYSDEIGSIASTSSSTWGYTNGVLADANPNLWDRLSSVNVTIQNGSLTGCTEADIDAVPTRNLALIGDEIVNFTTATLESDGTYTLSGFKRGRRGTEWATGTHADRDVFLLPTNLVTAAMGLSDVGTNMSFKAVTSGRTTSAFPVHLAPFTGASLKPYAPCHLSGVKDSGTGDWALSWVRRTRIGGAWTSGTSIPLGEASEAYEVEILNGSTVVRTITGLSSPAATWTAAQQTTDFGSAQSTVHFRVYQISDAVGRGFVASATV